MLTQPIFVFGAARSGTKIFRNVLASHAQIAVFPSEIDFIWRYGNEAYPTDALSIGMLKPPIANHIRGQFSNLSVRKGAGYIVDKTVANCLRLKYIHQVFPDALFIHLVRDGRAVVESSMRCWQGDIKSKGLSAKLKSIQLRDMLTYGPSYIKFRRQRRSEGMFGPRFPGIHDLVQSKPLYELCGMQWQACVSSARDTMTQLPQNQTRTIRYEDFVQNPNPIIKDVLDWIGLPLEPSVSDCIQRDVHQKNLEKWRQSLSPEILENLLPIINDELSFHEYK